MLIYTHKDDIFVLKNIFEGSIVQNIGDPNQQIYEKECWKLDKVMTIKDSMRCSCNIAKFASKFEVSSTNMSGRKNNNIKVKFIVYNDENINKVKEVFVIQIIGNGLKDNMNDIFKIIGATTGENANITLKDYFENYNSKKTNDEESMVSILREELKKDTIYNSMICTVYKALRFIDYNNYAKIKNISELEEKISAPEFRLDLLKFNLFKELRSDSSFKKICNLEKKLIYFILKRILPNNGYLESYLDKFCDLEVLDEDSEKTNWIYEDSQNKIKIEYGSIHSVKGETHKATLVVETFYYKYIIDEVLNKYIMEECDITKNERLKYFLRLLYVAFTRPTELLCVAIRKETFEKYRHKIEWLEVEVIEVV